MNGDVSSDCILNLSPEARTIVFNSIEYFWNQYWNDCVIDDLCGLDEY
jgi:hypothetical protein